MGDDHLILRRNHVQPLGDVLTDHMHGPGTARTGGRLRLDHYIHMRQVVGQRGPFLTTLPRAMRLQRGIGLFLLLLDLGQALNQVLEGQLQLVLVQLFRALAELQAPQLGDDVLVALILRLEPRHLGFQARHLGDPQSLALKGDLFGISLGCGHLRPRRHKQGAQGFDVIRKVGGGEFHCHEP
jgi:hypothetical protein